MKNIHLSIGAQGKEVQALHNQLIQEGLSIPDNEITDSYFGEGTQSTLLQWQETQGLEATGEVDTATANKLDEIEVLIRRPRLSGRQKKRLNVLTNTITSETQKARLEVLFTEAEGNISLLKTRLSEDEEFDTEMVEKVTFSYELADLLEDQDHLVTAFVNNNALNSLRDVARTIRKEDIIAQIDTADIPDDIIGETANERRELFATRINDRLFHMEPTGVIHRMIQDQEIAADDTPVREGLLAFFENQPELDFRKASVVTVLQDPDSLKSVPEEQHEAVVDRLKKLQRLSSVSSKAAAVPVLLDLSLDSAYAISEIPVERFVGRYSEQLGGKEAARIMHRNAQNITLRNEEAYLALRQVAMGASVNMVHGGLSVDARYEALNTYARDRNIPINFETLFGSVDLCECSHCNSVYSPSAYLVELFQYLRNNNLDPDHPETGDPGIGGTPLGKLFRRRPDLGHLQLTCENANTLIPYIDLVNEVMESFVVHLEDYTTDTNTPKQTTIEEHNVEDESSGELLAEPQHTNDEAYRILKDEVYPVCKLPYHQPIDTIRQYTEFLGTSRHELLSTFQTHISYPLADNPDQAEIDRAAEWEVLKKLSVDRAIAAEYLSLIEEEYVILTKEGFHTKEWYELEEETNLTLAEYHERIGLQHTWNYFGIEDENQMLQELKWVKPSQETGIVGFLRRTNILYVDLIELLKTRYINPNYLSGKALAYMNSLRFSYRYLQTLVDYGQADLELRYQGLVEFLIQDLNNNLPSPFTASYVACWVHRYFEKIGKLIVLEDEHKCNCIEGTIQLLVTHQSPNLELNVEAILTIDAECQIYIEDSSVNPKRLVGHLDTNSGQLILDPLKFFESNLQLLELGEDFLKQILATGRGTFIGNKGEIGKIDDLLLIIDGEPFVCTNYHEKCDLSKTQLQHLDGTDLETEEYDRMHRFIRLWCKLEWNIEEVDQAITGVGEAADNPLPIPSNFFIANNLVALVPSEDPESIDDLTMNPSQPGSDIDDLTSNPIDLKDCLPEPISKVDQEITPYLIEQLTAIKKLLQITGLELPQLLTNWTTIGVYGEKSLYESLFLKYNLIAFDDIFKENEFGTYLTKEGETISDHLPILMAALKVDANTIETIMSLASIADEMTLENVSTIYRHTLLIKTLGLRITQLSGLFTLTEDIAYPFGKPTQTLEFYKLFSRVEDSGFSLNTLNYLLLDEDDTIRPIKPGMGTIFRLAMKLRDGLLQIETDHGDIKENQEATEDLLRSKLSLIYDGETTEKIIALLQGTTTYFDNTRRKFSTQLEENDQKAITAFLLDRQKEEEDQPGGDFQTFLSRVQFSGTRGLQITGVLSEADKDRVTTLADLITNVEDADNFLITANKIYAQPERLFDDVLATIFIENIDAAKDVLLAEDVINSENIDEGTAVQKRAFFLDAFIPYLREELSKRMVIQTLAGDLGLDADITQSLMMDVIKTEAGDSIYQEIIRLKEQKDTETEEQQWRGFFVPEKEGQYSFLLEAEGDAALTFDNRSLWSVPETTDEEGINFYQSEPRFLKAGQAYPFLLEGYDEDATGNIIGLFMKFEDQAQVAMSDKMLFPALRTKAFQEAYIRLQKASLVIAGFSMKRIELEFFQEFADQFEGVDFNALTFEQWLRLEAFYRLQKSVPATQLTLVAFLRWSNQIENEETPSVTDQIHALTGWEKSAIDTMLLPQHFNLSDPSYFQNEIHLLKLQQTLQVAKKIGVGLGYLFNWGQPTSGFDKNRTIAGGIREVIRARYTQEEWEEAIKQVHDTSRKNRRDALTAYLLAQPVLKEWGVIDANSLFEFFLIDVQMTACMETSRIKQAISSVQLYVQRCFLGLEEKDGVSSKDLDRSRWEWMSHYRVWEANRKVFLYPENWILPELRDDKSPFFEELESELLQNDINKDTVKAALTKYIVQVDEVANLEVVGQYLEGNRTTGKLHVIGRTRNAPFFYYYRYFDYDTKYWYPWEKVEVDIPSIEVEDERGTITNNGAYAIPVVWKNRLFIFFPELMKKNWKSTLQERQKISDSAENKASDVQPMYYWEIKLAWTERKQEKWIPKQLSDQPINAVRIIDDEDNPEIEGERHIFDFYLDPEKFVFAPFVASNGIFIQPFYLGETKRVTEDIFNNDTQFRRDSNDIQEIIDLDRSFRFDSDKIKIRGTVNNIIPNIWDDGPYHFGTLKDNVSRYLFPIQAEGAETNPGDALDPFFFDLDDYTKFLSGSFNYNFHHPKTRRLLGFLRKNQLKKVFKEIGLDNDNYGSNNGIDYHELKRPYALYNWEMLFHSVGMLAEQLSKSQRFEESMQWWHYIFDPIGVQGDIKNVWKFLPFQETSSQNVLDKIFNDLDPNTPNDEINEWRENPFMPHVIARARPTAYMKWVVMKYIDNLIAWGDHLFRQDTIESINQATQLYILAGHILGPRPEIIPKRGKVQPKSYMDLVNKWDAFSNAMVDLELLFPFSNQINTAGVVDADGEPHYVNIYGFATTMYFCIPDNPKLLRYWDTVADRLFKIRHCLNIEGVFRKLNLFEPSIDPALLVQAAAQGLSIGSVLNDLSTPMPNYRFNYLLQRALEITSEVKSLGSALLSALEKKDGETLSLLRAQHETHIQELMMDVRKLQLEEAEKSLESLQQNRKAPEYRLKYYLQLAGEEVNIPAIDTEFTEVENQMPEVKEESGMKLIPSELEEVKKAKLSRDLQIGIGTVETLASILYALPDAKIDLTPLGVGAGAKWGGSNLGAVTQAIAKGLQIGVNVASSQSSAASRKTGFIRQFQDRVFQANLAGHELMQIDKQITAQKIRKEIAQLEIDNHQVQIEQTREVEAFVRDKFSNEQLYQWMSDQLKDLYYQTYSFAYDLAKKAEKVFRFEMGLSASDFIKFGYWDSSREGFLAGEQLYLALKHLENAYVETKPHDYEITKHISLQQLNPLALIQLKEEGVCEFEIPEEIFDLDYAGHYKRRIKTIAVSIPCIAGPYTSLNCTLRLLNHEYRNSKIASSATDYTKKLEEADERFVYNPIPTTAIAVSQGQNDSGVFELNFNGERYLPFEGAGAISRWRLELPQEFRQFDYETISDVIMHLSYTSCEGGVTLKNVALENLASYVEDAAALSKQEGLFRMLSLKHEFPDEWHRLLHPGAGAEVENTVFNLGSLRDRLPFFANSKNISNLSIHSIRLFTYAEDLTVTALRSDDPNPGTLTPIGPEPTLAAGAEVGQLQQYAATDMDQDLNGFWGLQFDQNQLTPDALKNAWLVIKYQLEIGT